MGELGCGGIGRARRLQWELLGSWQQKLEGRFGIGSCVLSSSSSLSLGVQSVARCKLKLAGVGVGWGSSSEPCRWLALAPACLSFQRFTYLDSSLGLASLAEGGVGR